MRAAIRTAALGLLVGLACAAAQEGGSPARVRALAEAGRLAEAETAARTGGAVLAVPLGEVLVLQRPAQRRRFGFLHGSFERGPPTAAPRRRPSAELAAQRGDAATAERRAEALIASVRARRGRVAAEDHTAAGRAYVVLGADDPQAFKAALRAFDAAVALDSAAVEPRIRLGDLFLDKYNAPDARASYRDALKVAPKNPRALLGLAQVLAFEGNPEATAALRTSLAANPRWCLRMCSSAGSHLDAEEYDSAAAAAGRALCGGFHRDRGLGAAGRDRVAQRATRQDSPGRARRVAAVHPRPALFYSEIAEAAARHRRYAEAARLGREGGGARFDRRRPRSACWASTSSGWGTSRRVARCWSAPSPAIRINVWYKNTLDLLDELRDLQDRRDPPVPDRGARRGGRPAGACTSARCSRRPTTRSRRGTSTVRRRRCGSSSTAATRTSRCAPSASPGSARWA